MPYMTAREVAIMFSPMRKNFGWYIPGMLAEFVGTSLIYTLSCPCTISQHWPAFYQALSFGGVLSLVCEVFGPFSGGHFNPAVSLGLFIYGKIDCFCFATHVIMQYCGGFIGYLIMTLYGPPHIPSGWYCTITKNPSFAPEFAFIFEFASAFAFTLILCSMYDKRNGFPGNTAPMRLGIFFAGYTYFMYDRSGSCFNPVRALLIYAFHKSTPHQWIYHAGPYAGSAFAGIFYRYVCDSTERFSLYSILVKKRPIYYVD